MNYKSRFEFAVETARSAGKLALGYFNDLASLTIQSKGVQDMASEADVNTEILIRDAVQANFPQDAFLGEESNESFVAEPDKGTWIVDPIDGTQPFVNGIRSWCISIAFYDRGELRVGVVYDPVADELFAAMQGDGATMNGKAIEVSKASHLSEGLVSVGFSNRVTPEATLGPLERPHARRWHVSSKWKWGAEPGLCGGRSPDRILRTAHEFLGLCGGGP